MNDLQRARLAVSVIHATTQKLPAPVQMTVGQNQPMARRFIAHVSDAETLQQVAVLCSTMSLFYQDQQVSGMYDALFWETVSKVIDVAKQPKKSLSYILEHAHLGDGPKATLRDMIHRL